MQGQQRAIPAQSQVGGRALPTTWVHMPLGAAHPPDELSDHRAGVSVFLALPINI